MRSGHPRPFPVGCGDKSRPVVFRAQSAGAPESGGAECRSGRLRYVTDRDRSCSRAPKICANAPYRRLGPRGHCPKPPPTPPGTPPWPSSRLSATLAAAFSRGGDGGGRRPEPLVYGSPGWRWRKFSGQGGAGRQAPNPRSPDERAQDTSRGPRPPHFAGFAEFAKFALRIRLLSFFDYALSTAAAGLQQGCVSPRNPENAPLGKFIRGYFPPDNFP